MARGTLLTGSVGGIMGAIAGFMGIVWSITDMRYITEIINLLTGSNPVLLFIPYYLLFNPFVALFLGQFLTPSAGTFYSFSMILAILLLVGGILTGIGFYGMYQAGGGAMGVVGLAFGIIGGVAGALFLILGNVLVSRVNFIFILISIPAYLLIFIGFAILGVSLILLGAASISVRESTAHSSAALAAGVLSIVGGCFLFPYILNSFLLWFLGGIFALIAFVLILSAFIIWAVVFYGSSNV